MRSALYIETIEEAVIEGCRIIVIALVPIFIQFLEQGYFDGNLLFVTAMIALLRAIDKYLHKIGQYTDNETLSKGLTRF